MIYVITPILYKTSSFNDILSGVLESFQRVDVAVNTNNIVYKEFKWYGIENPDEYFTHAIDTQNFIINNVQNWDTILFIDFFFPWLDLIKYYFQRTNIDVKMISLMHWASFISGDIYNWEWLQNFEKWWLDIYDYVIVPSQFFLKNIKNNSSYNLNKFIVLPWWLNNKIQPQFENKEYDVIFPHRFDYDKWIFDLYEIVKSMPHVNFIYPSVEEHKVMKYPQELIDLYNKFKKLENIIFTWLEEWEEHIKTLKKCKVILSTATQEGFWYAIMKGIQSWNIPVLPNRCCYPEFFEKKYLYSSLNDCCKMINNFLNEYPKSYFGINEKFNFDEIVKFIIKLK